MRGENKACLKFMLERRHPTHKFFSCALFPVSPTAHHATISVFNMHDNVKPCESEGQIKIYYQVKIIS